jgi:hypothetical protein
MPPPTQQEQLRQAEEAGRQLYTLIKSAGIAQLLQHPPPAAVSEQQQVLLQTCGYALATVIAALSKVNSATVQADKVDLRQQPVLQHAVQQQRASTACMLCVSLGGLYN